MFINTTTSSWEHDDEEEENTTTRIEDTTTRMSLCFYLPEISSWYVPRVPGSTSDEEVEEYTPIAVLTAPRLFLVPQIHDDENTNTTVGVVTAPNRRRGLP